MPRALDKVGGEAGSRVLEIGCGWGALARTGTWHYGAPVVGDPVHRTAGLGRRAYSAGDTGRAGGRFGLQDYRDISDAVRRHLLHRMVGRGPATYWPQYFQPCAACSEPVGARLHQSIVIRDDLFDRYRSTDFIQQYIFPGGCLPSRRSVSPQAQEAGLRVVTELAFGRDYALTPAPVARRLPARRAGYTGPGFDERFCASGTSTWPYCEGAPS